MTEYNPAEISTEVKPTGYENDERDEQRIHEKSLCGSYGHPSTEPPCVPTTKCEWPPHDPPEV